MDVRHLVLIDGHHLMYRAYWAIPRSLRTRAGEQTNTSFGIASMLLNIIRTEEPDSILMAFDAGDKTFRHQENETYKDGRAETPDDFYVQIPRVFELIDSFGIKRVSDPKYEADDFLASYAIAGEKEGMRVTIVTGDQDVLQLVNDNIVAAIPHKGYHQAEYVRPADVERKLGITPEQVVDYKGLCGDSSDNLPGVHGIGPKTAASLLQSYKTLDGIYENIDEIKTSAKDKLIKDKEQAYFCVHMADLIRDIPLPISLKDLEVNDLPTDNIFDTLNELEFAMLIKRYQSLMDTQYGQTHFLKSSHESISARSDVGEQMSML
ncbi:hypothetical protein HN512_04290 [Candidatus Peregrinibacteria bacterium]|jgi:DNA polymerase I|nr:hypothetical protein [Candidatus Peregrinibacteria bacterium]MBT3599029.1 hypothetical protein [Candidatus Peregrinibacteria bacterium]MBT4367377.1 hypothetical protein [Candidatus Peregrinibacteria bacterium]MBT4586259.1 hypothetical protein [Candidatus Peregrinibacteria bacterium]MBT6730665.1 hypothetical protein [Candidatus Peregrinibacteria bacterium]